MKVIEVDDAVVNRDEVFYFSKKLSAVAQGTTFKTHILAVSRTCVDAQLSTEHHMRSRTRNDGYLHAAFEMHALWWHIYCG